VLLIPQQIAARKTIHPRLPRRDPIAQNHPEKSLAKSGTGTLACAPTTPHPPQSPFALALIPEPNANLFTQQKSLARIARLIATLLLAKSASFDQPGQVS
jgi:hypothetical protein